jgi:hypothetical protein
MLEKENRKTTRYQTTARARIHGVFEGDALLKDLSITGCCIESTVFADLRPGVLYMVEIIPEAASSIGKFELSAEIRWLRTGEGASEAGFTITSSPSGKQFQRYVDYLVWRSSFV